MFLSCSYLLPWTRKPILLRSQSSQFLGEVWWPRNVHRFMLARLIVFLPSRQTSASRIVNSHHVCALKWVLLGKPSWKLTWKPNAIRSAPVFSPAHCHQKWFPWCFMQDCMVGITSFTKQSPASSEGHFPGEMNPISRENRKTGFTVEFIVVQNHS